MSDHMDAIKIPMLVAASANQATSSPVALNNSKQHYHGVQFDPATASGVVKVETAPTKDWSGAWTEILSVDATVDKMAEISFPGPGGFVRHRVSTVLAGGTVSSWTRRLLTT